MLNSLFARALVLLLFTGMAGCFTQQPTPDQMFSEYVERLARALDVDVIEPVQPFSIPSFPRRRERLLTLADSRIDMLDFLSLYGCDLQFLVGQRNSALGRVMPQSARWIYEISFLDLGRRCADQLVQESADPALISTLNAVLLFKAEQLPAVQWNAIWGGEEMEHQFRRNAAAFAPDFSADSADNAAWAAAELLSLLRMAPEAFQQERLEPALHIIGSDPAMARLVKSAQETIVGLTTAAATLEARLEVRPLCFQQKPSKSAQVLRNIFFNRYAAQVQPYLAELTRTRRMLLPRFQALVQEQQVQVPGAMDAFFAEVLDEESSRNLWFQLDRALHRHTQAWQKLLGQCGLMPGESDARPTAE